MNGVPSFAVIAGSSWNASQASGNQPSICRPPTGGVVGCVYFELSVPDPGGGNPIPVRLCGSVYGLLVVVRSATWWQSIHSAPRRCFHADRSAGQVGGAAIAGNVVSSARTKLRFIALPPGAEVAAGGRPREAVHPANGPCPTFAGNDRKPVGARTDPGFE